MQVACNFHIWLCFDFSFTVDSDGNKTGQIPRVAFRPDLQKSCNLETIYPGCSCDMGGVYCQPTDTLAMEPSIG